jgi:transposase
VIADNLGCHKVVGVEEALAACGASILYLPSYSPDMNPIELAFAKFKQALRTAAACTREALWETQRGVSQIPLQAGADAEGAG